MKTMKRLSLLLLAALPSAGCTVWESTEKTYFAPPEETLELGSDTWQEEGESKPEDGF